MTIALHNCQFSIMGGGGEGQAALTMSYQLFVMIYVSSYLVPSQSVVLVRSILWHVICFTHCLCKMYHNFGCSEQTHSRIHGILEHVAIK